ncbi:AIPR family protein [Bradyrhizobium sp. SZCCHNR2028]|uniref:AIPR family protein n=1 Tax=Bradyrhizobium sp. SZCCHNR2028 TaxID=3057382 RepID=UPI0028E2BC77|nr:AIPR family protein [Bradyrhizobium sp. SZCCHNR2028]
MQLSKLTFPVVSFRNLEAPAHIHKLGYRDYFAMVDVRDLPDLSEWRKINVRDPKLTGAVPNKIRASVSDNPDLFVFMNRGIVVSVESVQFDNKNGRVTIGLRDPVLHGLLDGGHTYNILLEERDALESPQYVRIEILEGFKPEDIPQMVDARNTSNQVRDQSLMNLSGEFDRLKKALAKAPYADLIAYKEYELLPNGDQKPIDVRDIIAILTAFERDHFDDKTHPINSYRSKAACLQHFKENTKSYQKIYPLAADILELYDLIQLHLPDLYNKVRGGKFGHLTGVTTYKGKHKAHLDFIDKESKYGVPAGFTYPILGGFRALVEEKGGRYVWGKNLDPRQMLQNGLGETLADTIGNFALDARNPSKTGKSPLVWQACYQAARVAYLEAN